MKEKVERIFIRISPTEKEMIKKYAENNDKTMSQFIRETCLEKIKEAK